MLTLVKPESPQQGVIADQYDELKTKICGNESVCDLIDAQKSYHLNRLAILAKVVSNVKGKTEVVK